MRTVLVLLVLLASVITQAHSQEKRPLTKEECDAVILSLGKAPGKIRSMPFKQLQQTEAMVFHCANIYQTYQYSATDATISQVMLERYEGFIRERGLDIDFFTWDARFSRK